MSFKEIYEEVVARGFDNIANEEGGEARIKRWINQAYREITDARAWYFLEATKEGTSELEISDLGHVLSVTNVQGENLVTYVERDELVRRDPGFSATGTASEWYLDGENKIVAYPGDTTSTLKVRYLKIPAALAADGDTPLFDAQYHWLIVDGACVRGYKATENYEAAQFVRQEWKGGLRLMIRSLRKAYDGNKTVVRTGTPNDYLG